MVLQQLSKVGENLPCAQLNNAHWSPMPGHEGWDNIEPYTTDISWAENAVYDATK